MKKIISISLLVVFFLSNCTKAIIEEAPTNDITKTVTYSTDIAPIMTNYCITCHGGGSPSAGIDLGSYQNVKFQTEQGVLNQRMNDVANPMPPAGILSANDRALMEKWIADGYLQ